MKQIAAALFDAMRGCAITPNSITYGLYTKALAEENSRQVRVRACTLHVTRHSQL
jgi:hypothetical protein